MSFRFGALLRVACFVAGAVVHKYQLFPVQSLRAARSVIEGETITAALSDLDANPRNSLFEAFHPHADVVMIGDSLTHNGEWQEMFPGVSIANRGISGDRSDQILQRLPTILESTPKRALIMFGINDIAVHRTVDDLLSTYGEIIDALRAAHVDVVIQSTLECNRDRCADMLDRVRELNKKLKEYASSQGIAYVDINRCLTSQSDGLLDRYTYDGTHLMGAGYVKWREEIEKFVLN